MSKIMLFREISSSDKDIVGVKGLNLSRLSSHFKVPPGFVITTKIYDEFIKKTDIDDKIKKLLHKIDKDNVQKIANEIQKTIVETHIPANITNDILEAYESLSFDKKFSADDLLENKDEAFVAVRSSYIKEHDDKELSQLTFLNIKGERRLLTAIKICFAAQYTAKNIMTRKKLGIEEEVRNAIIIQKMINADVSVIGYSINPNNKNHEEIYLKAIHGLGQGFNQGDVSYDGYVLERDHLKIKESLISEQSHKYALDERTNKTGKFLLKDLGKSQKLNDNDIREAARITKKISNYLEAPQKAEIAIKGTDFFVLQSKNIEKHAKHNNVELNFEKVVIHTEEEQKEIERIVVDTEKIEEKHEDNLEVYERKDKKIVLTEQNNENLDDIDFTISEKKDLDEDMDFLETLEIEAAKYQSPLNKKMDEDENKDNVLDLSIKENAKEQKEQEPDYDQTYDLKQDFFKQDSDDKKDDDNIGTDEPVEIETYDENDDEPEEEKDSDENDDSIFSNFKTY